MFDAEELQLAVEASLDFWLTAGRFSEQFESTWPSTWIATQPCSSIPVLRQPRRLQRADVAAVEGPQGAAGRRSDHRGRRLPHDRQPDHSESRRARLRGRGTGDLRAHRRGDRSGHYSQNPGRDDRPHHGCSLRFQGRGRALPETGLMARRGLLRRPGDQAPRAAGGHVRRSGHDFVLPGAPDHHG